MRVKVESAGGSHPALFHASRWSNLTESAPVNSYPAFSSFPASAGTTSPIRYTPEAANGGSLRLTLSGTFTARVQISNERATGNASLTFSPTGGTQTVTDDKFIPSALSWETFATVTDADPPLTVPGPVWYVRVIVDSGNITGGTVQEDETRGPPVDAHTIALAVSAGGTAGAAAGNAAAAASTAPIKASIGDPSLTSAQTLALLPTQGARLREFTTTWTSAAAIDQHPGASLDTATLTHTGAGVLMYVHDPSGTTDETAALTGRTAQITGRNQTLIGDGSGTALTLGGTSNFWAGALTSFENYYIRNFAAGIVISHNSYMLTFKHGTMTQMPLNSIGVQFQPGLANGGENITFYDWYFFNNAGTIIKADSGVGAEMVLVRCSLDYSRLAVLVRTYARVILDHCWIETSDAVTPAEYFRLEGGYLGLQDCVFIINDLSHTLIENVGGEVVIRDGRILRGAAMPRLVNDSAGGITRVSGLSYVTQNGTTGEQYDRLGQSGSLLSLADATLTGAATRNASTITFTPAGGDATAVWNIPIRPGQRLMFAHTFQLASLAIGTQPYHAYSAAVSWKDAAGTVISSQQLRPATLGTIAETEGRPSPNLPFFAPPRTVTASISLTAAGAASGTVTIRSVECWVL